jgi:alkylhydroperoxidase family enzyme
VRFAWQFATDHQSITPDQVRDLREHFTDEEIVELGMLCAQFVGFGRLVKVLGMELGMVCPLPGRADSPAVRFELVPVTS